jgi:hypothetical protein
MILATASLIIAQCCSAASREFLKLDAKPEWTLLCCRLGSSHAPLLDWGAVPTSVDPALPDLAWSLGVPLQGGHAMQMDSPQPLLTGAARLLASVPLESQRNLLLQAVTTGTHAVHLLFPAAGTACTVQRVRDGNTCAGEACVTMAARQLCAERSTLEQHGPGQLHVQQSASDSSTHHGHSAQTQMAMAAAAAADGVWDDLLPDDIDLC